MYVYVNVYVYMYMYIYILVYDSIDWFQGTITGNSHISWQNRKGVRLRFSLKSTHLMIYYIYICISIQYHI